MKKIKPKDIYMYAVGAIAIIGFFVVLYFMITSTNDYKTEVNIAIGGLITMTTMVFSYFFGSSKGSADKSETIDKMKENTKE